MKASPSGTESRRLVTARHDLRQPLQALHLFISALLAQRDLPPRIESIGNRLQAAADSLDQMLNGLFEIARIEAGRTDVQNGQIPLQAIFHRLQQEFTPVAEDKGLSLRFCPTRVSVESDAVLLERILHHLVANALRFTHQGGVLIGVRQRQGRIHIEIWDSGTGIPSEDWDSIFTEFHRVDALSSPPTQGLGLGLPIARRLAELLGHQIGLRSTPGQGSIFSLIIGTYDDCHQDDDGKQDARNDDSLGQRL